MQQGKRRLTGRLAATSHKHQLKHRRKKNETKKTATFMEHHSDISIQVV